MSPQPLTGAIPKAGATRANAAAGFISMGISIVRASIVRAGASLKSTYGSVAMLRRSPYFPDPPRFSRYSFPSTLRC